MGTPYDRLIPEIYLELLTLNVEIRSMWAIRVFKLGTCEKRFAKTQSKLNNVLQHLVLAGESHSRDVRSKWQDELHGISATLIEVRDLLEEKGWLRAMLARVLEVFRPLEAIFDFLGLGPLLRKYLGRP